jgi:hypothetical protein
MDKPEARTERLTEVQKVIVKSFLPVKPFAEKHPNWTESSLRWLIFNRETNGFKSVFRKVGKRVLIDEAAFFAKIDESAM